MHPMALMTKTQHNIDQSATMWSITMYGVQQDRIDITDLGSSADCLSSLDSPMATPFELILSDINLHIPDTTNKPSSKLKSPPANTSIAAIQREESIDEGGNRDADGHLQQPFTLESSREVVGRLSS